MNNPADATADGNNDPDTPFSRLLKQARAGDRNAIGQLVDRWRDYLLLIANEDLDQEIQGKVGPSDIVQQSMLAAQAKIADFRGANETEFRAWVRRIVCNNLADARRHYKTVKGRDIKRERKSDESAIIAPPLVDAANTPGTEAVKKERADILKQAMQNLPENYRQVIHLRNWDEIPFTEIGRVMGCSEEAARKLWYRAVMRLEEIINISHPRDTIRIDCKTNINQLRQLGRVK